MFRKKEFRKRSPVVAAEYILSGGFGRRVAVGSPGLMAGPDMAPSDRLQGSNLYRLVIQ